MIVSLNWLKKYVDFSGVSTDELVDLIGARLVEVEEVIDLSEKYRGIKIVEVQAAEKIVGSDHLSRCVVFDGAKEHQVVCGAPNVRAGMSAAWLAPGVVLPATFNEEPLVLEKRKLMGVESAGMLAAADELDLGADHEGIVEIDPITAKAGDDFAKVFELDDTILDIENKSLTHRPDCFGIIGFAREVAGILGQKFEEPKILSPKMSLKIDDSPLLEIKIDDPKLCPRYSAAVINFGHQKEFPYLGQMQVDIAKSGMRPIDRIVDVTNYLMLLTGQPLHAFDYDKLVKVGGEKGAKIIVRAAKKGEKLELLDGKTVECDVKDILITSNNKPVALAGAMGGANTAIDASTRRIIIESATFNLFNLRGTQFRHGIFSEAITRFTKGQPAGLTMPVLGAAVEYLGGKVEVVADTYPKPVKSSVVKVTTEQVNGVLGSELDFDQIITTLENVGFRAKLQGDSLQITAPWWRTDIHIAEDVIEEVGRLNGYDNITPKLPAHYGAPAADKMGELKNKIREILASAGANEVLTYSFVSEKLLTNAGQDPNNSYKIVNSISPELQYTRQSLTPSLLEKVYDNIDQGYGTFALFEINKLTQKSWSLNDENVPVEKNKVALTLVDAENEKTDFYAAKAYAEKLFGELGIRVRYVPLEGDNASDIPFANKQRAKIEDETTGAVLGVIGTYKPSVVKAFNLPQAAAGFELIVDDIFDIAPSNVNNHKKTSRYPEAKRDITLKVDAKLEFIKLESLIRQTLEELGLRYEISPVSIWQGEDKKTKNISFNLTFADYEKTLSGEEIAGIMDEIASAVKKELKGEVI